MTAIETHAWSEIRTDLRFADAFRYLCTALGAVDITDDATADAAQILAETSESDEGTDVDFEDWGIQVTRQWVPGKGDIYTVKLGY